MLMLNELRKILANSSPEEIKKEWQEVEKMGFSGAKAFEFIAFMQENYKILLPTHCKSNDIQIPEKMTPEFSGSFFFTNIAA